MLTISINKPVLLGFSHVKHRSHQTFLRINATWKVRVLDCDQIWLIRLYLWFSGDKQILSLNVDPHKIVESVKDLLEVEVRWVPKMANFALFFSAFSFAKKQRDQTNIDDDR
ncbi:uncharacterized protein [Pyrus communis]|uniref:uncharacterized protein n=1 Tax=Pyrus communis TaxID=23211 RepID=UPI0035C0CFD8